MHTHTHTHTRAYTSLAISFAIHETLESGGFFSKGISVLWQTHKSFYFFAIKQKSFLKPLKSLPLCSFGKCISCWNKPAVKFPWMYVLCNVYPKACHFGLCPHQSSLARVLHSAFMFILWGPASAALSPLLRASKFHPKLQCDSRVWKESKWGRRNEADSN